MSALHSVLMAVADDVIAARDELNRLDGAAGDGDMGLTMATAANALKEALAQAEAAGEDAVATLRRCGAEIARKAPSTSGTLVATGFLRAARGAGQPASSDVAAVAAALRAAFDGIKERGKANLGDKTMLDALGPALDALDAAASAGTPLAEAIRQAADAATAGAQATTTMRARAGRAGWLADRSAGHEDAGAHLAALALASAAKALAQ